ncbi:MAG: hypothetical protein MJ239_00605 [Bacilli bacterium]|nr:hypothetical protein [Bacilli bacterium]
MANLIKTAKEKISAFEAKHKYLSFCIVSLILAFFIVVASSAIASFFYPHMRADDFTNDPQFFYLTGQMIKNGAKPYVDINDHKGLYVFLYETLAAYLGGRFGLFFLELLTTAIELFIFQLIFDEFKASRRLSITMLFVFGAIMAGMFQYNNTEEIELVWLLPGMYFYLRGMLRNSDKDFMIGTVFWGVQAGITFNIRASDIMFAFAAVCFYAYYMLSRKKFLTCLKDAGIFLGVFALTAAPAYVIAYTQGYLRIMWDSAIMANISYTSSVTSGYSETSVFLIVLFVSTFAYLHFTNIKYMKKDEWMFFLINALVIGLYELLIAKFPHYWIMCAPLLVVNLARIITVRGLEKKPILLKGFSCFAILAFVIAASIQPIMYYSSMYEKDASISQYVKSSISEEDREKHTIMVDLSSGNYIACGVTPHYKDFVMQSWHSRFEDGIVEGLKEYLASDDCKYVVVFYQTGDPIRSYIESNFDLVGDKEDNRYCDIYVKR